MHRPDFTLDSEEHISALGLQVPIEAMDEALATAATSVCEGINEQDSRYPYVMEYFALARRALDREKLLARFPEVVGEGQRETHTSYGEIHMSAADPMRFKYGSERIQLPANLKSDYDPDAAFWSGEGMDAGAAALLRALLSRMVEDPRES